jgi:solute carrier family 25 (mitochondrial phosphate transporter), member 3
MNACYNAANINIYNLESPSREITHDMRYYLSCALGGVVASTNRWIQQPLDVVKVRMQLFPSIYPNAIQGLTTIYQTEGISGWYRGLMPTALAYASQAGTKYALYEYFKDQFQLWPRKNFMDTRYSREYVFVAAAASAEMIATIFMCPWEMLKVRLQSNVVEKNHSQFPTRFGPALVHMIRHSSIYRFPFGSLIPLWCRQVPGTVTNFFVFENAADALYATILQKTKNECKPSTQLTVTFTAGYIAGFSSAVSQTNMFKIYYQAMNHVCSH